MCDKPIVAANMVGRNTWNLIMFSFKLSIQHPTKAFSVHTSAYIVGLLFKPYLVIPHKPLQYKDLLKIKYSQKEFVPIYPFIIKAMSWGQLHGFCFSISVYLRLTPRIGCTLQIHLYNFHPCPLWPPYFLDKPSTCMENLFLTSAIVARIGHIQTISNKLILVYHY